MASYLNIEGPFLQKKKPFAKFALLRKTLSQENLANEDGKDLSFHGKSHVCTRIFSSPTKLASLADCSVPTWVYVMLYPFLCAVFFTMSNLTSGS